MKKYILFDLDGTLTDPMEGICKSAARGLAHFGIKADYHDLTFLSDRRFLERIVTGMV